MILKSLIRKHLQYEYDWEARKGDDPNKRSRHLFNRNQGYEVIEMIEDVLDEINYTVNNLRNKILYFEKLIKEELPSEIRSREKVKEWLTKRYYKDIIKKMRKKKD